MRFIRLLLAALCVAFGVAVAALNGDPVRLDLLWIELTVPLGLLLLGVLLLGALSGGVAALLSRARPAAGRADEDEAAIE
jgi:uncharacterized integral membrane protein